MWFRITTGVLLLWGLVGCFIGLQQVRQAAEATGFATSYDRALYAGLPGWYDPVFAVAVLGGLIGSVLLFMRRARARSFLVVSLMAIIFQFGWLFTTTDIVARKGGGGAMSVCVLIVAIAGFALWLVGHARVNRWAV
jgi:hypothetical protein